MTSDRAKNGYEADVHHSLTETHSLMGVPRDVFIGVSAVAVIGLWMAMNHCPWRWYWSLLGVFLLWAVVVSLLAALTKADPQYIEVGIHLVTNRDVDDV